MPETNVSGMVEISAKKSWTNHVDENNTGVRKVQLQA